jgi:ribosome-associated protein
MLRILGDLLLDEREIEETFIQASGPGGQNVNKVASAVQLRFDLAGNTTLPAEMKLRLARLAGRRLGQDGVLTIVARTQRSQERNREEARQRLVDLLRRAAIPPRRRIATKPPLASIRRQAETKRRRATVKRSRAPVGEAD